MGSTPGRHLEITGVSVAKTQGNILMNVIKGAAVRLSSTFFLFQFKWGENIKITCKWRVPSDWHQHVATELTADGSTDLFAPSALPQRKHWPWRWLHRKTNSLTKVPVSALDCNNFRKWFSFIEVVLFFHITQVLSLQQVISNNQTKRRTKPTLPGR